MILPCQRVHLVDHRLQRPPRVLLAYETARVRRDRRGLAVHHHDLGARRTERERVVVVRRWPAHHVVRGGRALSEHDEHHRHVRLLDRVDQRLAEAEQFGLLRGVADVDPARVLEPDHRHAVAAAVGDELVHLDEALAVELAADADVVGRVLGILHAEQPLTIADDADEEAVDLHESGVDLGSEVRTEFQMLAGVDEAREHVLDAVDGLLVHRHDRREVTQRIRRLRRGGDAEELRIVRRHLRHRVLERVENLRLGLEDRAEEPGHVVVHARAAGRRFLEAARRLDDLLRALFVEAALRAHAADDPGAADGHVRVLVREQHRRADALVAAAGGIGAVDPGEDRDAELLELGVTEEGGAVAAAVGVDLVLLGQLHARTVHEPDQRHAQALREIRHAELVLGLARDPRAGEHLVVEADHDTPLAADLREPVDHARHALFVAARVVEGVERTEAAGIDEVLDAIPHRHLTALADLLCGQPGVLHARDLRVELLQHRGDLRAVVRHLVDLERLERLPERVHLLEVLTHG